MKTQSKSSHNFDELLASHLPNADLHYVAHMTGGVSADAFLLDVKLANEMQEKLVLRKHGDRHCGHDARVEYQLLERLHSLGLPVPKPLGFAPAAEGRHPYVLLRYIDGSTEIPHEAAAAHIEKMATQLLAIHELATDTLPKLPPRFDPIPELLDFLPNDPDWSDLRSKLSLLGSAPFGGEGVLLHGDYWPSNVIWRHDEIAGVIDWEDAAIGDPLSDVACACLELRYIYGEPGSAAFRRSYAARRPIDPFRFALWQAYVAAAGNQSMGEWGLAPKRVEAMRKTALASIREAADVLCS